MFFDKLCEVIEYGFFFFGSEFGDIFDLDHFKSVLANDVRIVSSLPSTHVMTRPVEEKRTPLHASPDWIRSHYHKKVISFLGFHAIMQLGLSIWLRQDLGF